MYPVVDRVRNGTLWGHTVELDNIYNCGFIECLYKSWYNVCKQSRSPFQAWQRLWSV